MKSLPRSDAPGRIVEAIEVRRLVVTALQRQGCDTVDVVDVRVTDVRIKGDHGTVIGLLVSVVDRERGVGAVMRRPAFLRFASSDRLREEAARVTELHRAMCAPLPPVSILEDEGCSLQVFPFDRRLVRLADSLRPRVLVRALERVEGGRWHPSRGWRIRKSRSSWRVLSYRPERRAVIHWSLASKHDASGEKAEHELVVRTVAEPFRAPAMIYEQLASAGVRAPRLLAAPDHCTRIETFVPGESGGLDRSSSASVLREVGVQIGLWHASLRPADFAERTRDEILARAAMSIETVQDDDSSRTDALRRRLEDLQSTVPSEVDRVALHGDLHPGQWMVDGSSVTLLDFDRAVCGDAAEDLGNLVAHLLYRNFDLAAQCLALREGYESVRPWPSPRRLRWHCEAARLRILELAVRRPASVPPGWIDSILASDLPPEVSE